jgi:protein TonB
MPATPEPQPSILSSETSGREAASALISEDPAPTLSQASDPPLQQAAPPTRSTTQASQLEAAAATDPPKDSTLSTDATQPLPVPATASDTTAVSAIRPDYGWLQQAIFRRLEELKRSSRPSLDDSRPLKVLVKAVVSREGILLDSAVVKSSGMDRIDQEAMALVQRAFPMQLDRPLDRQQVAMRIPITYSRE